MKNDKKDPALKMPTPAEIGGVSGNSQLTKLLTDAVKDIYWTEQELLKALPTMQAAATTPELKQVIEEHIGQTNDHVQRLEKVFKLLGQPAETTVCEAMQGLISEGEHILKQTKPGSSTRDAGIILAAQKVEHYEIATYGALAEFARTLGLKEVVGLLNATLDEEKQADNGLTLIAQTGINWEAEHESVASGAASETW